LVRIETETAYD